MSIAFIGSVVALIAGIAFFIYYVFIRPKVKPEGLKHYEKKRDDLTERKEEEETEEVYPSSLGLGNLIGGIVVIIVGLHSMPIVAEQVELAQGNVTGAASTILDMTTMFYSLAIIMVGLSFAIGVLRRSGLV